MTIVESTQAVINQMAADAAKMDAEIEALREENGALQVALDNAADTIAALQRIAAELNIKLWEFNQQAARDGVAVSGGFKGGTE